MSRVLVLDSNVYGYAPVDRLAELADRGLTLRVSQLAFCERLARSWRDRGDDEFRERSRDAFLKRASKVNRFLDQTTPVALGGADLTRRIIAQADGAPLVAQSEKRAALFVDVWRRAAAGTMTSEHWRRAGDMAASLLDRLDRQLFDLCADPEVVAGDLSWAKIPMDARRRTGLRRSVVPALSDAALDRLDAQLLCMCYRVHEAKKGHRKPKVNDGADISLTIHVGESHILVTNDLKLIGLVDGCGTYQRAWVRALDDLDSLPKGQSWGGNAFAVDAAFVRGTAGAQPERRRAR